MQLLLFSNYQNCGLGAFSWSLMPHDLWSIAAAWSFKHRKAVHSTEDFSTEKSSSNLAKKQQKGRYCSEEVPFVL